MDNVITETNVNGELKEGYVIINSDEKLPITNVVDLQRYKAGAVVRLPDFAEDQPFVVRLKRPSMMSLVKTGKIPNQLLTTANELFTGGQLNDTGDEKLLSEMFDIIDVIIDAALIEPSVKDLKDAEVELTDQQLIAIFNYTQEGVTALQQFRTEQGDIVANSNSNGDERPSI